jgi:hypothetical protein
MKKQPEAEYAFWAVALDSMNTRVDASINLHLREPARAWISEDEPVICSTTMLEIEGACFLPE